MAEQQNRSNQTKISLVILVLAVAGNAVGYMVYTNRSAPKTQPAPNKTPAQPPAGLAKKIEGTKPAEAPGTQTVAVEQREAGLRALRDGDYANAIVRLEVAQKLDPDLKDVKVLLEVAHKLKRAETEDRSKAAKAKENKRVVEPKRPEPTAKRTIARRPRVRTSRRAKPTRSKPSTPAVRTGVLLVTTSPSELLVKVDGKPRSLSPLKLDLDPGTYQVELFMGAKKVFERSVRVRSGAASVISETFSSEQLATKVDKPDTASEIDPDGKLDLVELIEKGREAPKETNASARVEPPAPTEKTGEPTVMIFWPGRGSAALAQRLGRSMSGVSVQVLTDRSALREAIASDSVDAVIAAPYWLQQSGLTPSLKGGSSGAKYFAASFKPSLAKGQLQSMTLGVVDEFGKRRMPSYVADLLELSSLPKLRRVTKTEDLLPLLQFDLAGAILVRESELPELQRRTKRTLHKVPISKQGQPLAVAFIDGGRRAAIERAVLALDSSANAQLGVDGWSQ